MIRKLPRLAKTRRAAVSPMNFPARGRLVPEPYGVVLVCATWNYPLLLALEPVIGAVAAGNSVVLKLSDKSKATMNLIAELLERVSAFGQVVTVGDEFSFEEILKERFDYIFYTGSEYGGRKVLAAAAPHLTPVTLELGGKVPASSAPMPISQWRPNGSCGENSPMQDRPASLPTICWFTGVSNPVCWTKCGNGSGSFTVKNRSKIPIMRIS